VIAFAHKPEEEEDEEEEKKNKKERHRNTARMNRAVAGIMLGMIV
jgi:hypothetical protein